MVYTLPPVTACHPVIIFVPLVTLVLWSLLPHFKLAASKSPGLATVFEEHGKSSVLTNGVGSSSREMSSSSIQAQPMLSRGRRPSAAVVEADFAALRQEKVPGIID